MITNNELNEVMLSPTKKDYYQIWNELMELAEKISDRWSPTTTNESDPGIVLLKALTAVADKLNYNIDKNTLEAFMPSATQEDSMRKLTEMMGYDMKHYQSATSKAVITYKSSNDHSITEFVDGIYFPKFVNLKNEDEDINYVTLEDFVLQSNDESHEVTIIEGEVIECETNNDNIITALHLDDLNRYILPEYAIAENGIFITNIADSSESELWRKEQNLNTQQLGSKIYKFGVDSASQLPYIQFPDDIKTLIEDGLKIRYIRTNGLNGCIAAKVLTKFEKPAIWSTAESDLIKDLAPEDFSVTNNSAASNGADPESLTSAYRNYKKTIGTFDTLVTCRDYMNKIYQLTESDTDTTPLVSNVVVSDIRDDINRSAIVCSFNDYGICQTSRSLKNPDNSNKIEHFDLILYSLKPVYGLNNKAEYKNSFKYTAENSQKIQADLALNKTIAHNIMGPTADDIACIKNYLKLKAKVTTTKRVTVLEESEILNNIYKAVFANFNARQVDFGEDIPYESLVKVIKNADYRIKEISLDEPALETTFCLADQAPTEIPLRTNENTSEQGNRLYNQLALRNVLAGRISAFEYDQDFISEYDKTGYPGYYPSYPVAGAAEADPKKIKRLSSSFDVGTAFAGRNTSIEKDGLVLKENEVVQFRMPNFKTTKTYPAYVNYFIKLATRSANKNALPATLEPLGHYLAKDSRWNVFVNQGIIPAKMVKCEDGTVTAETFKTIIATKEVLFSKSGNTYSVVSDYDATQTDYYYLPVDDNIFVALNNWIRTQVGLHGQTLEGIYRTVGVQEKPYGRLIDEALYKYLPAYKFGTVSSNKEALSNFYVQVTRGADATEGTADGLGRNADYEGVPKDGEYELKPGEFLLINYTDSSTDASGAEKKSVVNKVYEAGDVIRANFNLIDSTLYHNNHSYSKKDGFYFTGHGDIEGMFTLGTNEQIEIREVVSVKLKEPTMHLYWTLQSDDPEDEHNDFIFTENYGGGINNAYTLKEGECLYYTNSKKQDLVYYGAGTLIVKHQNTPLLRKYASDGEASEEDILTNGLAANIPWQKFDLDGPEEYLEIIENQYITLTEGDVIISVDNTAPTTAISNIPQPVTAAEYRFAEDETSSELPEISVSDVSWTIRSRLDFNMSKTQAQALHLGDRIELTLTDNTVISLEPQSIDGTLEPVYLNSNYDCQAAIDWIEIPTGENDPAFKVKVSSQSTPKVADRENIALNNYVNGEAKYTKFNFANLPATLASTDPAFKLNVSIPDGFGLMMVYYIQDPSDVGEVKITASDTATTVSGLSFFNTGDTVQATKYLRPGINILKIEPNVKYLEVFADSNKKSTIVFGTLDLVKGINPKLDYRTPGKDGTEAEKLTQLLTDIRDSKIAADFYYNLPVARTTEIDLNPAMSDDLLSSPLTWYDTNNLNKKFVISEIDADYLTTGITLTKTSRA